jgi:hypothetical protein
MSVATSIRFSKALNCWNREIRSGWGRAEWIQIEGKLHSCNSASSWVARATDLTKIQTWLSAHSDKTTVEADLVELEVVQELVELPVLFLLLELEVVLLKTVKGQLGLVIDVDLEWLFVSSTTAKSTS